MVGREGLGEGIGRRRGRARGREGQGRGRTRGGDGEGKGVSQCSKFNNFITIISHPIANSEHNLTTRYHS